MAVISLWGLPIIILIVSAYFYLKKVRGRLYRMVEKYFDGPTPIPVFGNAFEFPLDSEGIYKVLMDYSTKYRRFFRVWLGPDVYIFLLDPKDVETLLGSTSHISKSDVYKFTVPWIGDGLLTSTGAKWKSRRRILTPAFHFKILEDFVDVFNGNGTILVDKLKSKAGKGVFDIYPFCQLYALDNIFETAFGVTIGAQHNATSDYVVAVKEVSEIVNMRAFRPWLQPDFLFNLSTHGKVHKKALEIMHSVTKKTIRERREALRSSKPADVDQNNDTEQKRRLGFLDLLLASEESSSLSDADLQEEVDTFMFEGHDTVTSGISFAFYALSKNPEIQEKVYAEQKEIFGDSDRPATQKDLTEMKYLERFIKECQRLYPSVPVIGRVMHEDLALSDGYVLPKGAQVMLFMPALHQNPNSWNNPTEFNPDNFLIDESSGRNPYTYVPFSAGVRNCIGQKYAVMELKLCISKVVRSFKLLPCAAKDEPQFKSELVLISANGVNVELIARN